MIIGIDLGTTNSLVAFWDEGKAHLLPNSIGQNLTPSVVSVDDDGSILIGQAAKERLQTHPLQTAAVFKRGMGTSTQYKLGAKVFRAEELSAFVLRSLKADAENHFGKEITQAVITVPAYFSDAQRTATRNAGLLAGLLEVTLLNEPTAAALAYGMHQEEQETQFLVFDLGGGTFDVSILELFEGVMEVRATAGDNQLGGEDFDDLIQRHFLKEMDISDEIHHDPIFSSRLRARIEAAKKEVNSKNSVTIEAAHGENNWTLSVTQEEIESIIRPLLKRLRTPVETALRDARIKASDLQGVVLAGGSTRLAAVRNMVTVMFGRFPAFSLNPDEVVALGAAVQAGLKAKDAALSERVMTDVCPYTLGIETSKEFSPGKISTGFMAPILERNTVIPASRVQRFSPVRDGQRIMTLSVYQGEARRVTDNIHLGSFDVPLSPGNMHEIQVDVRFTYDINGLLEVEATPLKDNQPSGPPVSLVIACTGERLAPEDVKRRLAALEELKIHPRERMRYRTALARAERLYRLLVGDQREWLSHWMHEFEQALDTQDEKIIGQALQTFGRRMDEVEEYDVFGK